jgi:hypothetical protein
MATTRSFSAMLNDYLPEELLKEEFVKRDFLMSKIEKDDGWVGASSTSGEAALIIPFKAAGASSVAFGALSASNDIAEDKYVRGRVTGQKEVWGSMIFNHRDLMEHESISEKNFLKILPNTIEDFLDYMKNVVSMNLMNGANFDYLTVTYTGTDGLITVAHPDRYSIGQKIVTKDGAGTSYTGYVASINVNTGVIGVATTRALALAGTAGDYTSGVDQTLTTTLVFNEGADTTSNAFNSLRGQLLSAANGGDSTIAGVTKTAYPYMQAINVSGAAVSAVHIMEKIFDALTTIRRLGRGNPSDVVMSYKNFASCMKVIEASKGAFNVKPGSQSASQYGWMEIEVGSVTKGGLKLVAVQEADDDVIFFLDWRALKFYSNGFFRKRKSPEGQEFFEVRATTGYQYIVDMCLFGEMVVIRPSYCGVMYSISY